MKRLIRTHEDIDVYQIAFKAAMLIYELSKKFPKTETYSMTDQIRRSSRSVCANTAEAFRKRRYEKAMIAKFSDAEAEAAETQVWLDFALSCKYLSPDSHTHLKQQYDFIIGKIVLILKQPEKWTS